MKRKYFGTDGIRGEANIHPITPEIAMRVGLAVGIIFREHAKSNHVSRVVIGKDTRLSCYMLENALVAGLAASGMDVLLLGPIPTPAVSMLCRSMRSDIGVMISASHNPYYYNGIKLFDKDGLKLNDNIEHKIEELIDNPKLQSIAFTKNLGRVKRLDGDIYRYVEFAKRTLDKNIRLDGLRIVIDCANGAAYKAAPLALWELGAEIITMHNKPDGLNINLECGSTHPASLIAKLKETRADIGIALDGDGDRVLIIDEKGDIVDGDRILAIIAKHWQASSKLSSDCIVATVMSNLGLERYLSSLGLKLIRTQVGDRYVAEKMRELGCNIGGEQSGHIIFSDYGATGDGLIAALQVLACTIQTDTPVSELAAGYQTIPQILKNVKAGGAGTLESKLVTKAITEANNQLLNTGRIVVRASGTEPLIRIMAEGDDIMLLERLVDNIVQAIHLV